MRMKKITLFVLITVLASCQIFASALTGIVEDLTNLVPNTITSVMEGNNFTAAIGQLNQLYQQYQKLKEQYETMVSQYEFLKKQGERWAEISSLKDAVRLLDEQMAMIDRVRDRFTERRYSYGGMQFSLEELFRRKNDSAEMRDLMVLIGQNARGRMKDSVDGIVGRMTAEQKMRILRDYGMAPDSYLYYMATMEEADKIRKYIFGAADEEMWATIRNGNLEQAAKILDAAKAENGKTYPSTAALLTQVVAMTHEVIVNLNNLSDSTMKLGAATAYQVEIEEQEKRDRARMENYQKARAATGGGHVDANF